MRRILATTCAAAALTIGLAAPASAQPTQDAAAIGGLVAAVVQAQDIDVIEVGDVDVNVQLQNVLNNNRILTNFLNENDINVEDVVDVVIVDNVVTVLVDAL